MPSRARGSFGVVAVNLPPPARRPIRAPECAKGRDQVPAPATNLPAEGGVRQEWWAGGGGVEGQAELEAGAAAGRGGVGQEQLTVLVVGETTGDVEAEADPPARRVAPESSWVKRSKMRSRSGAGTPGSGVLHGEHGQRPVTG